ncbi:hypothetical protein QYM36_014406 [Artemia franciscana]|uniref:Uncharacterized protein n=1 Tax=Artemia franciscana TaxID=6661 RepID=A0AA88HN94_ARTSF|nr:hypothetical protein QYM36_014406 [Artemia franciscana]
MANALEIAQVVDASIKNSLSGFENAVKTLDFKNKEEVKDIFKITTFKGELKAEINAQFKAIKDKIHTLELYSGTAKDNNALKYLVSAEVATLREAIDKQFKNSVKATIAKDHERQKKKTLYSGLRCSFKN